KYTRHQLRKGVLYTAADYVQAQRVRSIIKQEVASVLADVDVLFTPTTLTLPATFEGYDPDALADAPSFMSIWNLTGSPALSVNCGFSTSNLPLRLPIGGTPLAHP